MTSAVLVVGGGLVGCAIAWNLVRAGARVLLAERSDVNSGASGQNAGSLHFQLERRFLEGGEHSRQLGDLVALNSAAIDDWRRIESQLGADLGVRMHGGLMVAETDDEARVLERKHALERSAGVHTEIIDGDTARTLCPSLGATIRAATFAPFEGHADPRLATVAFARAAESAGAVLRSRTSVAALERTNGGFVATLVDGMGARGQRFDQVVIAAGAWSPQVAALLNVHLPLYPVALQMNATEACRPLLGQLVQHVGKRLSIKQTTAGNVLIGGGWAARLRESGGRFDPGSSPAVVRRSLIGNLRAAVGTIPLIRNLALLRTWTGVTAISADQLPLVGEVGAAPGCYVAAGGSAFTLGPTFARLLASRMGGRSEPLLQPVAPERFAHLNSFMGA